MACFLCKGNGESLWSPCFQLMFPFWGNVIVPMALFLFLAPLHLRWNVGEVKHLRGVWLQGQWKVQIHNVMLFLVETLRLSASQASYRPYWHRWEKCFTFHFHAAFCGPEPGVLRPFVKSVKLKVDFESRIYLKSIDGRDMIKSYISLYFLNSKGVVFDSFFPFHISV